MVKLSLPHPIPITNPTSPFRNFNFMRPIKIVGSDTDLHDYQVRIHLDRSNFPLEKCKPDGSDIRFRDDSGEILPYWIERWNAAEGVIWCKIPFIPAESSKFIWMIYGNPNAKSESNGNAVFEMFDVQDIVGFWHFDEPQWTGITGEVKDETGVNHGTAGGGATTTSDAKYGRAGYFDGEDDYVDCGNDDSLSFGTDDFSICLWFKTLDDSAYVLEKSVSDRSQYYHVGITTAQIFFRIKDGTYVTSKAKTTINDNSWHFFCGIRRNGLLYAYLDGVDDSDSHPDASTKDVGTNSYLHIGKISTGSSGFFSGIMDEVCIWERALSPTEVQILYNNYMQKMGSYFNVRKYVTPAPVVIV